MSGQGEAGTGSSGGDAGKEEGRPPHSRQRKVNEEGNGKMVGPRVGDKNPSSRAEKGGTQWSQVRFHPLGLALGKFQFLLIVRSILYLEHLKNK